VEARGVGGEALSRVELLTQVRSFNVPRLEAAITHYACEINTGRLFVGCIHEDGHGEWFVLRVNGEIIFCGILDGSWV